MPKNSLQARYLYLLGYRDNLSLGKCFHYGWYVKKDFAQARTYYLNAAQHNDTEAFSQLHCLFHEAGCASEADYYLGRKYESLTFWQDALTCYKQAGEAGYVLAFYRAGLLFKQDRLSLSPAQTIKKDLDAELSWYRKAAAAYSKHALDALITLSTQEPNAALHLAQMYEQGEIGNKKCLAQAITYYEQASKMRDAVAAYRLGQLYEYGEETFHCDYSKAFAYYLIAAKKQDQKALAGLERIVIHLKDPHLTLQLADIYDKAFGQKASALLLLKEFADQGHHLALSRLITLAKEDAPCAYKLANTYVKESRNKENAYLYYVFAMQNNHPHASDKLHALAESGDAEAQYALGALYYYAQKKFFKALHWCLGAAEQQHDKAIHWLKNTIFPSKYYVALANRYAQGEGIHKNQSHALYFYEKAHATKNKAAALHLGQIYQFDEEEKAFAYFIDAVQWGHTQAIDYLERLATELDAPAQFQLANLYRAPPFNNFYKALYWAQQAIISKDSQAAFSDEVLVKLIEDTEQVISFENLNLFARNIAYELKLTVPSCY